MRDRPRRIQIDDDGMIWFWIDESGKIERFDPKTETFKEYPLPNAKTKPYALGIAPDRSVWYLSEWRDVMGRLHPATGKVTEYPMPYTDNGMRDFFLDKEGRIWFATLPTTASATSISPPSSATPTRGEGTMRTSTGASPPGLTQGYRI